MTISKDIFNEIIENDLVIHCKTKEESDNLVELSLRYNKSQRRVRISKSDWNSYKEDTCYWIKNETYASIGYCKDSNIKFIEYKGLKNILTDENVDQYLSNLISIEDLKI